MKDKHEDIMELSVFQAIGYQTAKETYLLRDFAYTLNPYSFPLFTSYSLHPPAQPDQK